jgi:hypothetical protein
MEHAHKVNNRSRRAANGKVDVFDELDNSHTERGYQPRAENRGQFWHSMQPSPFTGVTIDAMEFNPSDSAPRSGFELLPAGEYDVEVIEAEERTSQKGNQMIALTLQTRHPDGYDSRVWDFLVSVPAAVFKIKMFCEAAGLQKQFEGGRLTAEDCVGGKAVATIIIEDGREGFSDRNSIQEYRTGGGTAIGGISTQPAATSHATAEVTASTPLPVTEEDIPF